MIRPVYRVLLLLIISFTSCDLMDYKNQPQDEFDVITNKWNEANHSHLKPMYGNLKRTSQEKLKDEEFINGMLHDYKDKSTSAKRLAERGWYYFFHNVTDTAMFRFNQSWLMDSTYIESYFGFAAIRENQGLSNEAEKLYELAYQHDKTDTLAKKILNKIGYIREKQMDTASLLNSYHRAFNKFPSNGVASGKLGYYYSMIGKKDSALKYYNITIGLDPEYEQTYLNRGWLFYQEGKYDLAISDYTTVIENNSQSIYGYVNRANVFMDNKQYELAIMDINYCIELDPKHPNFHFAKAKCYHQLKQDRKACEEIEIGIKKGGKYSDQLKKYNCK